MTIEELKSQRKQLQERLSVIEKEIKKALYDTSWLDKTLKNQEFLSLYTKVSEDKYVRNVKMNDGTDYDIILEVKYEGLYGIVDYPVITVSYSYSYSTKVINEDGEFQYIRSENKLKEFLSIDAPLTKYNLKMENSFVTDYQSLEELKRYEWIGRLAPRDDIRDPTVVITKVC